MTYQDMLYDKRAIAKRACNADSGTIRTGEAQGGVRIFLITRRPNFRRRQ